MTMIDVFVVNYHNQWVGRCVTIADQDMLKRQMTKGLSAAAVYCIHVQIGTEAHYSIKSIETIWEIHKIAAIFWKNRIQFAKK